MPSANYRNLEEHRGAVEARATALAASLQARDLEIDELRAQITALLHAQHDAAKCVRDRGERCGPFRVVDCCRQEPDMDVIECAWPVGTPLPYGRAPVLRLRHCISYCCDVV